MDFLFLRTINKSLYCALELGTNGLLKKTWFPGLLFLVELKLKNYSLGARGRRVGIRTLLFVCFVLFSQLSF